ncbi:MAG: FAD-dependent oxidoreductase [Candidatus Solibacter sp.]
MSTRIVIAGGGMVAGYAAKALIELGLAPGDLTIVSADSVLPYERPPLSKTFLTGKDSAEAIRINPEDFYRDHGIGTCLQVSVTGLDARRKALSLSSGEELRFDSLVLATGSRAARLKIPGAELPNILYLRSLADAQAIRARMGEARRAVVIGGGFIAMEVSSVLAQSQIETTMVLPDERVWKRVFTPEMSESFESYFASRGVRFVKMAKVQSFRGDHAVSAAILGDGRELACDTVVAGVGAIPVTEYLQGSGLEPDNGIRVDEFLETSASGIFAAGDIANYPDLIFGKRRRVEHWDNAVSQAQHCARVLSGGREPFRHVPYFFSDVFDLSYEYWGDSEGFDEVVYRGDLAGVSWSAWWLQRGVVVAGFVMGRPNEEREAAPRWIESRQRVSRDALRSESTPIDAAVKA